MKKVAGERNLEKQAERLAEALRRAGYDEETVQRRVQRAVEGARSRGVKGGARRTAGRKEVNLYVGCRPVSDVAREFRMRRIDLFARLWCEGWLCRAADSWRPTEPSMNAGWAVLRGRGAVQWVQLTPAGVEEIARRIGIAPGGSNHG